MKRAEVERILRQRIVEGRVAPGGRLPPRLVLLKEFGCSPVTLQRAIENLRRGGFLETNGAAGTFVTSDPPHLTRFGLVFPHRPGPGRPWSLFWSALRAEAEGIAKADDLDLPVFYDSPTARADTDFRSLLQSVVEDRLSGIVFMTLPFTFQDTPILDRPGIPRVTVASPHPGFQPRMPFLYVDFPAFVQRALDCVAEAGRRRVALITTSTEEEFEDDFCAGAARRRLATQPQWIHPVGVQAPRGAMRAAHLLMSLPAKERPDALIIADDNLVDPVTEGLAAAGVRVPRDLLVVAHCNYLNLPLARVPVTWLGFSARAILERCIDDLRKQRAGESAPDYWVAPPLFEHEVRTLNRRAGRGRALVTAKA